MSCGSSTHFGGGGVHGSWRQLVPKFPPPMGWHCSACDPLGHVPLSGIGSHAGAAPPQHGRKQYCVTPHVSLPHANGASAGGGDASLPASGSHAISRYATDHFDPVHVARDGPPAPQP
jgi:hypothetical protein